jgi:S1-C subfamily serine protease
VRLSPFVAGLVGGGLSGIIAVAVIIASGGVGSSTKTVTVVQELSPTLGKASYETHGLSAHQIYERDDPGVVFVSSTDGSDVPSGSEMASGEGGQQGTTTGSGFEIDGAGTVLTNWHVVEGAAKVMVSLNGHGKTVQAQVIGKDPSHDVAVLQIPTEGLTLHPLVLGESSSAKVGEPVLAIGNPFGYTSTLTTGVISALGRRIQAPNGVPIANVMQTDVPLDPGSSGGPLLNALGQVIGINSQIVSLGGSGGDVGISFSIPIDLVKDELGRLEKGGT